jgi:hypothetical protein
MAQSLPGQRAIGEIGALSPEPEKLLVKDRLGRSGLLARLHGKISDKSPAFWKSVQENDRNEAELKVVNLNNQVQSCCGVKSSQSSG